jgi:hypothetical protein
MRPGRTTAGSPLRRAWRSSSGPSSSPTSSVALPIPPLPASGLRATTPVTAPSGLEGRGSRRGPQDPAELPLLLRQRRLQGRRGLAARWRDEGFWGWCEGAWARRRTGRRRIWRRRGRTERSYHFWRHPVQKKRQKRPPSCFAGPTGHLSDRTGTSAISHCLRTHAYKQSVVAPSASPSRVN